jgi:hypothetical protein
MVNLLDYVLDDSEKILGSRLGRLSVLRVMGDLPLQKAKPLREAYRATLGCDVRREDIGVKEKFIKNRQTVKD